MINASTRPRALALARGRLALGRRTLVMGVLNVTPDSFSDGGRFLDPRAAVERAHAMAREGADLIDIGGESTRPGAVPVPLSEEVRRVMPVVEALAGAFRDMKESRPLLSVDTRKAEVARRAAEAGADLINDVSGLTHDPAMAATVADSGLPIVIQHTRGTPETMQRTPRYSHLLPEIAAFLRGRIDLAVRAGVREDRIIVDPGIGFGKRRRDNLGILRHLRVLASLGRPILVGASRKSFLKGQGDLPTAERLEASLAAEALAIAEGADIIRVHDVREGVRVASLCDAVLRDPVAVR
ncbi:MAG: dihydropteroate synthase [Acidobacteria bacterium 13_1_40CM_2_68_5]|nr:MAG: dihydropteroate synthase [Acidobacteria bacterium 13_1_40CM_2_68_5]OLE66878.1 MAG: dihydropteroate synthase [Acidobacteria bacterium 13_1_20CM_2_68_7]